MKTCHFLKISFCLFLVSSSFSCGKGGGGDVVDTLIPVISVVTWRNISDIQHNDLYFFFNESNPGTANSTFEGNESIDGITHSLSGSYQNSKISFTFNDGPKQGTTYTGKISDNSAHATITLTTPTGIITLRKQ